MKVFLDTNVLASALTTRGLCADLFREVIASEDLVVSAPLFTELRRTILKKFHAPTDFVDETLAFLERETLLAPPGDLVPIKIKDQDDVVILSSALRGKTDVFVTGDKEVHGLKKIGRMEILTPREFWGRLKKANLKS